MTTIRAGGEEVTFPESTIEPHSELSGAFSLLYGRAEDPTLVLEKGIKHSHSRWGEIEVDGRRVDDYMKDVASRAAFDWLLVGPENWDEDLYVELVDAIYGRLVTALDEASVQDARTAGAYSGPHRQLPIDDFILTECQECGSEAEYISENRQRFQTIPSNIKEKYEEAREGNLYQCKGCESYLWEPLKDSSGSMHR